MSIIICGSRDWTNRETIRNKLKEYTDYTLITGGCRGADNIANYIAKEEFKMDTIVVKANWKKYGKSAGSIRNRKMLDMGPKLVLGFHNNFIKSKGTKDMALQCRRRNIEFILCIDEK